MVFNKDGFAKIENSTKLDGRGAYICKDENCINECKKKRALNRAFKTNIAEDVYEELLNEFKNK